MFRSCVMVQKLYRKADFLQFCANVNKKTKFVKAIYILYLNVFRK